MIFSLNDGIFSQSVKQSNTRQAPGISQCEQTRLCLMWFLLEMQKCDPACEPLPKITGLKYRSLRTAKLVRSTASRAATCVSQIWVISLFEVEMFWLELKVPGF